MIIGIDPGKGGAIALMDGERLICVRDMPVSAKNVGKGEEVNAYLLYDILEDFASRSENPYDCEVWIESVSSMPKEGVTSARTFGRSVGVVEGILPAFRLPVNFVTPQKWKKFWNLSRAEKDKSRTFVISQWPEKAHLFARKMDVDRAEAVLIAAYGGAQ